MWNGSLFSVRLATHIINGSERIWYKSSVVLLVGRITLDFCLYIKR